MTEKALKLAYEVLLLANEGRAGWQFLIPDVLAALKEVWEQPKQEPVVCKHKFVMDDEAPSHACCQFCGEVRIASTPLTPPAQPAPVQEPRHTVQLNGRHSPLLTHMMNSRNTPPAAQQEPVGEVGTMPGTTAFTMACFKAEAVPVGTKLYTTPPAAAVQEPVAWGQMDDHGEVYDCVSPRARDKYVKYEVRYTVPLYTTPPSAPVQEPSQREFENWLRSKWTAGYACPKLEGRYTDEAAQSFWECWQAAHGIKENT
jgi:hypothetical protein